MKQGGTAFSGTLHRCVHGQEMECCCVPSHGRPVIQTPSTKKDHSRVHIGGCRYRHNHSISLAGHVPFSHLDWRSDFLGFYLEFQGSANPSDYSQNSNCSETGILITPLITLKIQVGERQLLQYQDGGMPFGLGYGVSLSSTLLYVLLTIV